MGCPDTGAVIKEILQELSRHRMPHRPDDEDPMARAWASSQDAAEMVELLRIGERLGLYEVSSSRPNQSPWLFRLRTPEGKYIRMEFTDEGGGARNLRALLPELAPYKAWAAALEKQREQCADSVHQLVMDFVRIGAPDTRWLARWTLPEAWRACRSGGSMMALLRTLGREDLAEMAHGVILMTPPPESRASKVECEWSYTFADSESDRHEHDEWMAEMVRGLVPDPPPLPARVDLTL
jgi:hypothetical protein